MSLFSKNEQNTGRQYELDYMKAIFIPLILLFHSFQICGNPLGTDTGVFKITYMIATMTGSAIFFFVMGIGSTYSKSGPKKMVGIGFKLLGYEIIWNTAALSLPLIVGQIILMLFFGNKINPATYDKLYLFLLYINVFFMAGISYLCLALLRKLRLPDWGYLVLAVLFIVINPLLFNFDKSNSVMNYMIQTFFGGRPEVSLIFSTNFVYVLFGVWFGKLLRRTINKNKLYLITALTSSVLIIFWWVWVLSGYPNLNELYIYIANGYFAPSAFRAVANIASTAFLAAIMYTVLPLNKKIPKLHEIFMHFSLKTSQYYAVHVVFYVLVISLLNANSVGFGICITLAVINLFVSFGMLKIYDKIRSFKSKVKLARE